MLPGVYLALLVWVTVAVASQAQDVSKLPAGCTVKTFTTVSPAGWFATNIQDSPEGREGCYFIRLREDKSAAAVIQVESLRATLTLFEKGDDPFETLVNKIAEGLEKNMNVVVKGLTYKNDDLKRSPQSPFERASMAVFDADVPGDARAHEVVIAVARGKEYFVTVFVVTLSSKADPSVHAASTDAFRAILNSLNTVPGQR
jgi:hypothetical protein